MSSVDGSLHFSDNSFSQPFEPKSGKQVRFSEYKDSESTLTTQDSENGITDFLYEENLGFSNREYTDPSFVSLTSNQENLGGKSVSKLLVKGVWASLSVASLSASILFRTKYPSLWAATLTDVLFGITLQRSIEYLGEINDRLKLFVKYTEDFIVVWSGTIYLLLNQVRLNATESLLVKIIETSYLILFGVQVEIAFMRAYLESKNLVNQYKAIISLEPTQLIDIDDEILAEEQNELVRLPIGNSPFSRVFLALLGLSGGIAANLMLGSPIVSRFARCVIGGALGSLGSEFIERLMQKNLRSPYARKIKQISFLLSLIVPGIAFGFNQKFLDYIAAFFVGLGVSNQVIDFTGTPIDQMPAYQNPKSGPGRIIFKCKTLFHKCCHFCKCRCTTCIKWLVGTGTAAFILFTIAETDRWLSREVLIAFSFCLLTAYFVVFFVQKNFEKPSKSKWKHALQFACCLDMSSFVYLVTNQELSVNKHDLNQMSSTYYKIIAIVCYAFLGKDVGKDLAKNSKYRLNYRFNQLVISPLLPLYAWFFADRIRRSF